LYGVGEAGQVSFTTGCTTFSWKDLGPDESGHTWLIPILVGYRHNFSGLYVEPQLGYGIVGDKYEYSGISASDSENGFAWGADIGFARNGFDGGVRYQGITKDGTLAMIGFHVGYNFTLGGKK
jgi:hypothetical protein